MSGMFIELKNGDDVFAINTKYIIYISPCGKNQCAIKTVGGIILTDMTYENLRDHLFLIERVEK